MKKATIRSRLTVPWDRIRPQAELPDPLAERLPFQPYVRYSTVRPGRQAGHVATVDYELSPLGATFGEDIRGAVGSLTTPNAPMLWPLPNYHGTNISGLMVTQQLFDNNVGLVAGKLNSLDLVQGIMPEIGSGRESFLNVNALVTALPWFRFCESC